jgi:hypothetical protein
MSAVVPFGVIVAVAIVFIVIAVLSSAQRADDVALDTEQQLFMRALADRSERVPEISDAVLKEIAWRLGLNNLRRIDAARSATGDHVLQLADEKGEALARFAWTPSTPGQEIIYRVIPFVLGCAVCVCASCRPRLASYATHRRNHRGDRNQVAASGHARPALWPSQSNLLR